MPPQQNPYEFILDPQAPNKGGPAFVQNKSKQLLLIAVFISTVLLVIVIAASVILNIGKQDTVAAKSSVGYQTELARIAELGLNGSKDPSVRAAVSILQASMNSDAIRLSADLANRGAEINPKELVAYQDATVEQQLTSASQRNAFDTELYEIISTTIQKYKPQLTKALNVAPDDAQHEILTIAATNIQNFEKFVLNQ